MAGRGHRHRRRRPVLRAQHVRLLPGRATAPSSRWPAILDRAAAARARFAATWTDDALLPARERRRGDRGLATAGPVPARLAGGLPPALPPRSPLRDGRRPLCRRDPADRGEGRRRPRRRPRPLSRQPVAALQPLPDSGSSPTTSPATSTGSDLARVRRGKVASASILGPATPAILSFHKGGAVLEAAAVRLGLLRERAVPVADLQLQVDGARTALTQSLVRALLPAAARGAAARGRRLGSGRPAANCAGRARCSISSPAPSSSERPPVPSRSRSTSRAPSGCPLAIELGFRRGGELRESCRSKAAPTLSCCAREPPRLRRRRRDDPLRPRPGGARLDRAARGAAKARRAERLHHGLLAVPDHAANRMTCLYPARPGVRDREESHEQQSHVLRRRRVRRRRARRHRHRPDAVQDAAAVRGRPRRRTAAAAGRGEPGERRGAAGRARGLPADRAPRPADAAPGRRAHHAGDRLPPAYAALHRGLGAAARRWSREAHRAARGRPDRLATVVARWPPLRVRARPRRGGRALDRRRGNRHRDAGAGPVASTTCSALRSRGRATAPAGAARAAGPRSGAGGASCADRAPACRKRPARPSQMGTFQDLLATPHDEALFEHYATRQFVLVDAAPASVTPVGAPGLHTDADVSPDGRFLLVERDQAAVLVRACLTSTSPRTIEVWDRRGAVVEADRRPAVSRRPCRQRRAHRARATSRWQPPRRPRSSGSRRSTAATRAQGAAPRQGRARSPRRSRRRAAEIAEAGTALPRASTGPRRGGGRWSSEYDRDRALAHHVAGRPRAASAPRKVSSTAPSNDAYGDPGNPVPRRGPTASAVARRRTAMRSTSPATAPRPEGDRPFLDRFDLGTLAEAAPVPLAATARYEPFARLRSTRRPRRALLSAESPTEPPNCLRASTSAGATRRELTDFPDPAPQLAGLEKRADHLRAPDGVQLSGHALPAAGLHAGQARCRPCSGPTRRSSSDAGTAGQVRGSPHRFTRLAGDLAPSLPDAGLRRARWTHHADRRRPRDDERHLRRAARRQRAGRGGQGARRRASPIASASRSAATATAPS